MLGDLTRRSLRAGIPGSRRSLGEQLAALVAVGDASRLTTRREGPGGPSRHDAVVADVRLRPSSSRPDGDASPEPSSRQPSSYDASPHSPCRPSSRLPSRATLRRTRLPGLLRRCLATLGRSLLRRCLLRTTLGRSLLRGSLLGATLGRSLARHCLLPTLGRSLLGYRLLATLGRSLPRRRLPGWSSSPPDAWPAYGPSPSSLSSVLSASFCRRHGHHLSRGMFGV